MDAMVKAVQVMTEYPPRLQMSMLAPVRKLAELIPEGDKDTYVVGYVFGEARGVSFRNNPNSTDDAPASALIGIFEGIPSYKNIDGLPEDLHVERRARLASGVCFLPPQAQETIVKAVLGADANDRPSNASIKRGQRNDRLGVVVPVNVEIGIRKSSSPVGYEWVVRGIANAVAQDPIERMRAALGTDGADVNFSRMVTHADKSAPQIAAPAKEAAAGKKAPAKKSSRKR
jgi:hypothetical protein